MEAQMTEPTSEDQEWFAQVRQGVIGLDKPKVVHKTESPDPYLHRRIKAANKLGVSSDELADEPDYLAIDDQPY